MPRTLPHNAEAEAAVLGGILLEPAEALPRVVEVLVDGPGDFYVPAHQDVYAAVVRLEQQGKAIDLVTLAEDLSAHERLARVGGVDALAELAGQVPTVQNIGYYAKIVRDKASVRRMVRATSEIASEGYTDPAEANEYLDRAETRVFELAQRLTKVAYRPLKPLLTSVFETIEARHKRKADITGVPTGYPDLDRITAGLQPSDLIIVAARPSMGKTSFCINVAHNASLHHQVPVLVFSLEMSAESLVERILSAEARVDSSKLRSGHFSGGDWRGLAGAAGRIAEAPVFIDDSAALTVLEIRAKARRWRGDAQIFPEPDSLGVVIVDYLQLVRARANLNSREREVAEVSRGLKALAKEIKLPVIALSQLRRAVEDRKDQRPQLSDLRESGAIEQDADVIAFIHRNKAAEEDDERDPRAPLDAELIIGKQRNGPLGSIRLQFFPAWTQFVSRARAHREVEP